MALNHEWYMDDALLSKKITTQKLPCKSQRNHGEQPMYHVNEPSPGRACCLHMEHFFARFLFSHLTSYRSVGIMFVADAYQQHLQDVRHAVCMPYDGKSHIKQANLNAAPVLFSVRGYEAASISLQIRHPQGFYVQPFQKRAVNFGGSGSERLESI